MTLLPNNLERRGDARSGGAARTPRRAGMTLIELLVVIAIIAVIAAVSIGALMANPEHARTRGTEALVAKINSKLVQRLDQFNARRDSVKTLSCDLTLANTEPSLAHVIAIVRTMRQDFPEWFELQASRTSDMFDNDGDSLTDEADEIIKGDWNPVLLGTPTPQLGIELPSGAVGHLKYIERIFADNTLRPDLASFASKHKSETTRAECLYMIVTADGTDTAEFAPNEIGDTDSDGLPEFIDKWGRPIQFFLWPTHYTSPRQKPGSETNPDDPNQLLTETTATGWWTVSSGLRMQFEFLFFSLSNAAGTSPRAYRTYPLIISAGSDDGFGLQTPGPVGNGTMGDLDDIGTIGTTNFKRAERITNAGQDGYGMDTDNIENHSLRVR